MCLRRLISELHGYGVEHLIMAGRTAQLNARDMQTNAGARYDLPKNTSFRLDDVVVVPSRCCGQRDSHVVALIENRVYKIEVETGCGHA